MRNSVQKQGFAGWDDVPLTHFSADSLGLRFGTDRPAFGPARAPSFESATPILSSAAQAPSLSPNLAALAAADPSAGLNETPDPNDTIGSAQAIDRGGLTVSGNPNLYDASLPSLVIQGSISSSSDTDYFSITLQAGELLVLDVDGTNGLDSHLHLFGPNGTTEIGDNDDYVIVDAGSETAATFTSDHHNTDSLIHFRAVTAGTYYFSIESFQDPARPTSGAYQLNVSIGPQATAAQIAAEDIQALQSGASWNHTNLTFGFPTLASQYPSSFDEVNPSTDFSPFTGTQINATVQLLQLVSNVAPLTFTQNSGTPGQADLRYAMSSDPEVKVAYAYYPTNGGPNSQGGSAWFNETAFNNPIKGNYAWMGILHETGHALGLKHGHEFPIALSADHDSIEYSIMTYRSYPGGPLDGYSNEPYGYAQTLMMYDIAALQAIYGANFTINNGTSVYTWNPSTGEMSINGVGQGAPGNGIGGSANRVFLTVWDGGGADTYDMSNYGGGVSIDLTPGGYSTTSSVQLANLGDGHFARGNVFNALQYNNDARSLIENAIGGAGNDVIVGNAAANSLEGRAGNDLLNGAAGADTMAGGADNDIYIVDNSGDMINENAGEGLDTVFTSVSYTIGNNVERLGVNGFTTTYAIDLTGNALDNEMWGNDGRNFMDGRGGADIMQGFGGDDIYIVDNAGDQVIDTSGLDTVFTSISYTLGSSLERLGVYGFNTTYAINLTGNAGANEMWGNDGANLIDGGAGADIMQGFGGNDIYVVDNAGDVVIDTSGFDTIFSSVSYTLGSSIERLGVNGFTTTYDINLTGNALDNEMWGNDGRNVMDGGAGADIMQGFGGDDFYIVDNAGDVVIDTSGFDTVFTSINYTIGGSIERLGVNGFGTTYTIDLTGNALSNEMWGNDGRNVLDGGAGADVMQGFGGDDLYIVDNVDDRVIDTGGFDTVFTSVGYTLGSGVERLGVNGFGTTYAINLTGNGLANEIWGNDGVNTIDGGLGADILHGNGGADIFAFTSVLGGGNIDTIIDFAPGADKIVMDDAVFTGLLVGALDPSSFRIGSAAGDADDRIIYDSATGALYFDPDGDRAAAMVQFATVHEGLPLTASDFSVI